MVLRAGEGLHARMERERKSAFPWSVTRDIKYYRAYAKGKQSTVLTTEQRRILQGILGHDFADNVCRKILSVATGRIELLRWTAGDDNVTQWLANELWLKNRFASMHSQIVYSTLRDGNHCVGIRLHYPTDPETGKIIEGAKGRVQLVHEPWWDGKTGMFVKYDDYGNMEYAVKEWWHIEGDGKKFKRRTFYFPHLIRRFIMRGQSDVEGGWSAFEQPEDDPNQQKGVIPWVRADNRPLGIPVVHYASVQREDDSPYGISHLAGGVLAFQDQINSLQYDLSASSMYAGYQMTYSTGTKLPDDPDNPGQKKAPKVGPGQHFHADESDARIGVLEGGDVTPIKDSYRIKQQAVCRMTDTPLHFLTGEWPSGEALLRAEIDLVELARRIVESIGPDDTLLAHRATEIWNTFLANGEGAGSEEYKELDEDSPILSKFADPQRRDRLTMSQIATLEEKYTSKRERLRITGRTDEEVEKIIKEMEDEAQADAEMMTDMMKVGAELNAVGEEGDQPKPPGGGTEPATGSRTQSRPEGD